MTYRLEFTAEAKERLKTLESPDQEKQLKAVRKCLGVLETNPRHPSPQSKPYQSRTGPEGERLFESYAEQNTLGAYRVFWYYGKNRGTIVVASIVKHP